MSTPPTRPSASPTSPAPGRPDPKLFLEEPEEGWLWRHRARVVLVVAALASVLFALVLTQLPERVPWLSQPHRILKVMLGGVLALVILSRPFLALALMPLAFVYLIWLPKSPIPLLNGMNLIMATLLYGWIGRAVSSRRPLFESSPLNLPLGILLGWTTFQWLRSVLMSGKGLASFFTGLGNLWGSVAGLVLFFAVYNNVRTWKQIRLLAFLFCVGSALGVIGLAREALSLGWDRGVGGGVGQVNEAAAYFATSTIFCIGMLSAGYRGFWTRLTLLCALGGSAAALVIPASRGAYAAFLIGACTQLLRSGILWILLLGALVGGFFLWAPDYVIERATRAEEAVTADEGAMDAINEEGGGRIDYWKASLQITAENPILGVGYGQISKSIHERIGKTVPSHNLYLETAAEMGIPGLAMLLWVFVAAIVAATPLLRERGFSSSLGLAFQSAIIVLMIANIFGNRFHPFNLSGLYSFLSALVLRGRRLLEGGEGPEPAPVWMTATSTPLDAESDAS